MSIAEPVQSNRAHGAESTQGAEEHACMDRAEDRPAPTGAEYGVCHVCVRRFRLDAHAPAAAKARQIACGPDSAPRCECGSPLQPYAAPGELSAPARGVLPRLTRFWLAGREDGYWEERRFFRAAAAERAGTTPRQVRFAYEAGRRVGDRLRAAARSHRMRVARMNGHEAALAMT